MPVRRATEHGSKASRTMDSRTRRLPSQGAAPVSDRSEPTRDRPPSGAPVDPLPPALWPARVVHDGRYARLEPLDTRRHAEELYAASHGDEAGERIWDYLS